MSICSQIPTFRLESISHQRNQEWVPLHPGPPTSMTSFVPMANL